MQVLSTNNTHKLATLHSLCMKYIQLNKTNMLNRYNKVYYNTIKLCNYKNKSTTNKNKTTKTK